MNPEALEARLAAIEAKLAEILPDTDEVQSPVPLDLGQPTTQLQPASAQQPVPQQQTPQTPPPATPFDPRSELPGGRPPPPPLTSVPGSPADESLRERPSPFAAVPRQIVGDERPPMDHIVPQRPPIHQAIPQPPDDPFGLEREIKDNQNSIYENHGDDRDLVEKAIETHLRLRHMLRSIGDVMQKLSDTMTDMRQRVESIDAQRESDNYD